MQQQQQLQQLYSLKSLDLRNCLEGVGRYEFQKSMGSGTYGHVVAALDRHTNEIVAIKLYRRGEKLQKEQLRREILNHRTLDHPHVVKYKELVLTNTYLGIVMEYADKGNLKHYIASQNGITCKLARFLFQQLVLAVDYCHQMNVVNRDIKLENTLVFGNNEWPILKLCDFGFSKHQRFDAPEVTVVGTVELLAPEMLFLEQGETYDGRKADIWCIGLFLYSLICGRSPFCRPNENPNEQRTWQNVLHRIKTVDYQMPPEIQPDCGDLISRILICNPGKRPTMDEIQHHPYFTTSLPAGASEMNSKLKCQQTIQTDEEIDEILREATKPMFA